MNGTALANKNSIVIQRKRGGTAYDLAGINKTSYVVSNYTRAQQQGLILNFKI
jgi:hypothetical protein